MEKMAVDDDDTAPPRAKVVTGRVKGGGMVTLTGENDVEPGMTFRVKHRDSIRWEFSGVPPQSKMRVRFFDFEAPQDGTPPTGERRLFREEHHTSPPAGAAGAAVIATGPINPGSAAGRYFYKVYTVDPQDVETLLRCTASEWSAREWGGGDKSGRPVG